MPKNPPKGGKIPDKGRGKQKTEAVTAVEVNVSRKHTRSKTLDEATMVANDSNDDNLKSPRAKSSRGSKL